MGNAEDKEETEVGTMSVTQSEGQKDAPPNLDPETVCSNGSGTDEPSTVPGTKTEEPLPNACELLPNTCEAMETDELDPSEGPPELQPYDIYQGPDFSETFDSDAFDSIGLNSFVDEFENDGRDTPELHLYDTATDEDFEGSNFSFSASGDGLMFNQDEITNELNNEGQSVFSGIRSETEVQGSECPMLIEDQKLDKKGAASQEEDATEEDRTGDSHTEKEDNQDEDVDKSSSKEDDSLSGRNEVLEEQKQEISEKEEERSKRDATLDTFSAILASRSLTHKVLADIAAEWITHELKEVDQKSMPEVFQVPTCQSTWQLLSGERIYTRERQKKKKKEENHKMDKTEAHAVMKYHKTSRCEESHKMDKTEARAVIKNLYKKGKTPKEIHEDMVKTLGEDSPSYSTVKKWVASFKRGKESTKDDPRSGRPKSATTDNQVEAIHRMVKNDRRVTIRHIGHSLGISYGVVQNVLSKNNWR